MAIIPCKECKNDVSDTALKCPSCGVQLKKAKRTFMGKVFKWLFIIFNILMLVWLVVGLNAASETINNTVTSAERAGAQIGTGIGAMLICFIWVIGDFILGLFVLLTRPK